MALGVHCGGTHSRGQRRLASGSPPVRDRDHTTDRADLGQPDIVGRVKHFFSRDAIVAGPGYNRYMSVPASFAVQLSVGSVYAWSVFNAPLMREHGVVAAAEQDWELGSVIPIFSTCALTLGFTTALLGEHE